MRISSLGLGFTLKVKSGKLIGKQTIQSDSITLKAVLVNGFVDDDSVELVADEVMLTGPINKFCSDGAWQLSYKFAKLKFQAELQVKCN